MSNEQSQEKFIQLTKLYYKVVLEDINIVNKEYLNSLGFPKTNLLYFKFLTHHYKLADDLLNSLQLINTVEITSKKQLALLNNLSKRYFDTVDMLGEPVKKLLKDKNPLCQQAYEILLALNTNHKNNQLIDQTYTTKMTILKNYN